MKPFKSWWVYRDGKPYTHAAYGWLARQICANYRPGSKHKWTVVRVLVTPLPTKRGPAGKGE